MHQQALAQLLNQSIVTSDEQKMAWLNTATFRTDQLSQVLVQPKEASEIVKLLQFCTDNNLTLHVVSAGKNWGFGSMVPVKSVDILLDLSLLNRIIEYNSDFGTVRCEAGVTFQQLTAFLKDNGNIHFLNTIGGDPYASVVGNLLERGDGVGPYCERWEYACSPEVILADGTLLDLGFGNIQHSQLADLSKTGIGANFQELFVQANVGIVTKITLWLCRVPIHFRFFQFYLAPNHNLSRVLNQLKTLYQQRILNTPITFWNDYKQTANAVQFPYHLTDAIPLSRKTLQLLSNDYSTWYAFGGMYVDDDTLGKLTVRKLFKHLKNEIKPTQYWSDLSAQKVKVLRFFNFFLKKTKFSFDKLLQVWEQNPLLGQTSAANIKSLFWRKREVPPSTIDPQTEQCGLHWNSFLIPFNGEQIVEVLAKIDSIVFKHGFEPIISFVVLNDRYVKVFQQLIFDREKYGEDVRALICHREVFEYLQTNGYSATRLDILTMNQSDTIIKNDYLHKKIKSALDPKGIISPGKYFMG